MNRRGFLTIMFYLNVFCALVNYLLFVFGDDKLAFTFGTLSLVTAALILIDEHKLVEKERQDDADKQG